jgi:hypothetical protein
MRRISWSELVAARRTGMKRGLLGLGVVAAVALCPAATAGAATFSYTHGEQTFVVPPSAHAVDVVATGAPGGTPSFGTTGGRGDVVSGILSVTPGEVLYVEVGGPGGQPTGGFNGGGEGGTAFAGTTPLSVFGGGGASDVRLISSSASGSLGSRVIVAAGGGGSAIVDGGGDAGAPGDSSGGSSIGGGAGTQTAGGSGGCGPSQSGCGGPGLPGAGGAGGASGTGADAREGGGGGGGLFGGGGGAGNVLDGVGGGGGGSSLVPANGLQTLAPDTTTAPSVVVTALTSAGGGARPVTGNANGTATFASGAGTTRVAGHLSQLGAFTASSTFTLTATGFSPPFVPYEITGTTTFVAANGDELYGSMTGTGTTNLSTGDASGLNVVTITGGTGRFVDAIGTLAERYTSSIVGGTITLTIQGVIGY